MADETDVEQNKAEAEEAKDVDTEGEGLEQNKAEADEEKIVDTEGEGLELDELETEEDAKDIDMVRVGDSAEPTTGPKPVIEIPDLHESPQDLEAVYDVPVQVSAVLGKATMQVNQLLKLGRGAVVELDRKVGEAIDIYVNNRLVARGEVVVVEERLGVTMTEIIKTERT